MNKSVRAHLNSCREQITWPHRKQQSKFPRLICRNNLQ